MLLLKDEGYTLSEAENQFENNNGKRITTDKVGVSKGTYWVYFQLNNEVAQDYIFSIKNWTTSYMEFHIKKENSENFEEKINWQESLPFYNKRVIHSFELKTSLEANTNYTCLLKISYPRNIYIPLHIYTVDTYNTEQNSQVLKSGLFYGFYMLMFLIVIFLYIQLKDNIYFYYGGIVITTGFYILLQESFIYQWFADDFNLYVFEWVLIVFFTFFTTFFVLKFNDLEQYYPKLYKIFIAWIILILLCFSVFFSTDNYTYYIIANYAKDLSFIFFWIVTLMLVNKKPYIKYYAIIYAVYVFLCFIFLVQFNIGVTLVSAQTVIYAATIKMFLMLVLTVYRFRHIQSEREHLAFEKATLLNDKKELLTEKDTLLQELLKKETILTSLKNREQTTTDFSTKKEKLLTIFELTKREQDIVEKMFYGKSNKQIATELNVSLSTVKQYSSRIYKKMNVSNRVELITFLDKI